MATHVRGIEHRISVHLDDMRARGYATVHKTYVEALRTAGIHVVKGPVNHNKGFLGRKTKTTYAFFVPIDVAQHFMPIIHYRTLLGLHALHRAHRRQEIKAYLRNLERERNDDSRLRSSAASGPIQCPSGSQPP